MTEVAVTEEPAVLLVEQAVDRELPAESVVRSAPEQPHHYPFQNTLHVFE